MANKICSIDIETNCLLSDALDYSSFPYKLKPEVKFWVIVVTDFETEASIIIDREDITKENVKKALEPYDVIVAHNGLKFDFVKMMLAGLLEYRIGYPGQKDECFGKTVSFMDTLVMSRVSQPDRFGGHGLAAWGDRLGFPKTDYRAELIAKGVLDKNSPKGHEFTFYDPLMVDYCVQDTRVTIRLMKALREEMGDIKQWASALRQEHKLADLAIRRESLGFHFDKDLALRNLEELTGIMDGIQEKVNPILPKKELNKGELAYFTPPATQLKKDGTFSSHMLRFFDKLGIVNFDHIESVFEYKGETYQVPHEGPLETHKKATVDDLDVVKEYLIELGWDPSEWRERDLTKDSKKRDLPMDKRIATAERYVAETLGGKYKSSRLKKLGLNEEEFERTILRKIRTERQLRVPTSPSIRVGVAKDMCPNLESLGETVDFAKDVAEYYTYRHRKTSIAGGDTEDMDFDEDVPNTGYLSNYREQDGRIATPAIEVGANTHRYKHMVVANIPRTSSLFGGKMRAMFGAGPEFVQFGFDYSSLEARIEGNYLYPYAGGPEMAVALLAEKPNDLHTMTAEKLDITRDEAKSVNYAILYGASANKFVIMLGMTPSEAKVFYNNYWESNPPLKELKEDKEKEWLASGKKYIKSIDGRLIHIRSKHSILNALFQSSGVICAKYVTVKMFQKFEEQGYCIDVFKGKPDIAEMISYHDENQLVTSKDLVEFEIFRNKEEAEEFVLGWTGDQLGAIQELPNGAFYITLPGVVSRVISESIEEIQKMFNMHVDLGYEYVTGRNWKDCH